MMSCRLNQLVRNNRQQVRLNTIDHFGDDFMGRMTQPTVS